MNKREQKMGETRAKLVKAARAAFGEKGYEASSMDDLTAAAGLTRGALYHNFGDKPGLLRAVIEQIDAEMLERMQAARDHEKTLWQGFLAEGTAYIMMAIEPEIQRIVLLDGPAVLGDPSQWPNQNACLLTTMETLAALQAEGTVHIVDTEAVARLVNGAALNAALWVASSSDSSAILKKATDAFRQLMTGLLIRES